ERPPVRVLVRVGTGRAQSDSVGIGLREEAERVVGHALRVLVLRRGVRAALDRVVRDVLDRRLELEHGPGGKYALGKGGLSDYDVRRHHRLVDVAEEIAERNIAELRGIEID